MRRLAGLAFAAAALAALPAPSAAALSVSPLPRHATLGASVGDAEGGVKILAVLPGTPAAKAGLRAGDVVTEVGSRPVANSAGFLAMIKAGPAGRQIGFAVRRDGAAITVKVTLASAPDEKDPAVTTLYEAVPVEGSLRRTLVTLPRDARGPRPALLIVGGIGCYSVDVAADPNDSYLRIAHDLGKRGFVVMRLEKSGVGDSQGPACPTVDLASEMQSYEVALEALRRHADVDPAHLYIFGHSIGTLIAPRLAAKQPVAGLLIAEGVGRNWIEYELANLRRQLVLDHVTPVETDDTMRLKEICMHRLLIDRQTEADIEKTEPRCKESNAYPAPAAYMQQAAAFNIAEPWTKLALPVLVVYGTADFVTAQEDHQRIADLINAGHPGTATLKVIDGMDHLLDVGGTAQADFDRGKKGGKGLYDTRLSAALLDWLCAREHCANG